MYSTRKLCAAAVTAIAQTAKAMISENVLLNMVWPLLFTQVSNVKKIEEVKGRYAAFGDEDRGH
jgi:hypothetical protein